MNKEQYQAWWSQVEAEIAARVAADNKRLQEKADKQRAEVQKDIERLQAQAKA